MELVYENFRLFNCRGLRLEYFCIFIRIGALSILTRTGVKIFGRQIRKECLLTSLIRTELNTRALYRASYNPVTWQEKSWIVLLNYLSSLQIAGGIIISCVFLQSGRLPGRDLFS